VLSSRLIKKWIKPCENLSEKNFPKNAKIKKNQKKCGKLYCTISIAYDNLRKMGNYVAPN
jgi:hypothetical protein